MGTAKATLETNELNLDFTKVISPIDGRTSRYNVTVGNLVQLDVTLLTTIVSVDPIYAYSDVDERTVLHVRELIRSGQDKIGPRRRVARQNGFGTRTGISTRRNREFRRQSNQPQDGHFACSWVFENKDQFLTPGLFARVRIPSANHTRPCSSATARSTPDQGQKIVFIVDQRRQGRFSTRPAWGPHMTACDVIWRGRDLSRERSA